MNTAIKPHQTTAVRGEIFISDQAIAAVVRGALGEVKGVYGLVPLNQEGKVLGVLAKTTREHSDLYITSDEDGALHVKLHLIIEYGLKLDEVAREAIETVCDRVRTLAGVEVANIEVKIKGLHHPQKEHLSA